MGGRHPSGPATRNEAAMLSMSLKSLSNEEESIEESEGEEVVTHSGERRVVCQAFVSGVCVCVRRFKVRFQCEDGHIVNTHF